MATLDSHDFLIIFCTSAGVILFGAGYALFYALSILRRSTTFHRLGIATYAGLLLCLTALSLSAHFSGLWWSLSLLLAVGYFWMPRVILQLTVATHKH